MFLADYLCAVKIMAMNFGSISINQIITVTFTLFAVIDMLGNVPVLASLRAKMGGEIRSLQATIASGGHGASDTGQVRLRSRGGYHGQEAGLVDAIARQAVHDERPRVRRGRGRRHEGPAGETGAAPARRDRFHPCVVQPG